VVRATWYQVAKYCNWLSKKEGLSPCYKEKDGKIVGVEDNYLEMSGYRLPTEAEVEYTNRANTKTCRYFGETEELLHEYAWYEKNSGEITQTVGALKPNDFGLFDMQGNAFTWCHDRVSEHLMKRDDVSDDEKQIDETTKRVLRGGAFYFMAISLRAARRHDDVPTMQGLYYSFRVAKTMK
jgi:formylglycine-generating enzyme required for sulfatase activity